MDTRLINAFFLILLLGFLSSSSCEKQCTRDYKFEEDISITNAKDTFQIGDTFFIEVNTPTYMHDLAEDTYVEMKDHGIITYLHLYQIHQNDSNRAIDLLHPGYQNAMSPDANNKFTFKSITGLWTLIGSHGAKIEYDIQADNFIHKTAVIVKDTGLFYFRFFDPFGYYIYNPGNNPDLTETDCHQYWNYMRLTVNNGKTNYYLLEDRGIVFRTARGTEGDTQKHNCKYGSWSFVVVP